MKNCVMGLRTKLANRKENNKGFTLVELIVVIVILAILAAILIPGLMKWIDEARNKQYELEARSIFMAAEGEMTKLYGAGDALTADGDYYKLDDLDNVNKLSGLTVNSVKFKVKTATGDNKDWTITEFITEFTPSDNSSLVTMKWTAAGNAWERQS